MRYSKTWIGVAAAVVLWMAPSPAADVKAEVELRTAVEQETVKGDLKGAIERYKKIVAAYPRNRSVAARALFHIGSCYEKLGQAEAQNAYQRLVREYSDQKDIAVQAQSRLASLGGEQRGPATVTMRRLSAGQEPDNEGRPSPDGQWLSYTTLEGGLGIYNLLTGEKRVLKRNPSYPSDKHGLVEESIWSPDGKQIAYGWEYCGDDCVELRVMQADGTGDRTIYRPNKPAYVYPYDWSLDGKYISALIQPLGNPSDHDLVLLDARTGEAHKLKAFPSLQEPHQVLFSPDGRYLAYDLPEQPESPNRDIWLMSLDGSQTTLVRNPADDRMLAWLPDGVLFASDRTGTMDVWMQPVTNGKPQGPPERLRAGIGNLQRALGLTRKSSLYYSVRTAVNDIFVAQLDPATGKVASRGTLVSQRHAGRYGYAVWSPDGKRLAAIAKSLSDKPGAGFSLIVLHDMATGEERDLKHSVPNLWSFNWTPDGQSLLAAGFSGDKRGAIYKIDRQTGEAKPLITSEVVIGSPQMSPDGGTLYYQELEHGHEEMKIVALNLSSGSRRVVARAQQRFLYGWGSFALSPDGERVVFAVSTPTGRRFRMLVAPASGGEARLVHESAFEIMQPSSLAWSPDGRYVLFFERPDVKSAYELWRLPLEGGQPEKLGLAAEGYPALRVHPDGMRISYSSGSSSDSEIWVLENFLPARAAR